MAGCDRLVVARGYCNSHYRRFLRYGDPAAGRIYTFDRQETCSVAGCDDPYEARNLCRSHYKRLRKYGDPLVVRSAPDGSRHDAACTVDGCSEPTWAKGFCQVHYQRWRKHGNPLIVKLGIRPLVEQPKYSTVHARLRKAKSGRCSTPDCERTNTEMALIHGRGRFVQPSGQNEGRVYSDRLEDYLELCAKCHRRYDSTSRWLIVQDRDRARPA